MSAEAVIGLDNITEMEKYYMNDTVLDNFNASVAYAWPNATDETRAHLLSCQESLNNFNSAADNINYEIIDKLKTLTDEGINADDDCLYALRRLNETNSLQLVPCAVAEKAQAITQKFKAASFQQYSATKNLLVPNINELNSELESLTAALIVNPNELGSRIAAFTVALNEATRKLENSSAAVEEFAEIAKTLSTAAEGEFKELSTEIKNLSPKLAAEIASEVPTTEYVTPAAPEADVELPEDIAEDAELAPDYSPEVTSAAASEVTSAAAPEATPAVAPEATPAVAPVAA